MNLVQVNGYSFAFESFDGVNRVLDGVNLEIMAGESVGIVGETGCGKSLLVKSLIRLVDMPPGKVLGGEVKIGGVDVLKADRAELVRIRRDVVSMVFQDPTTFLNPLFCIGAQMADVITARSGGKADASEAVRLLKAVGLPDAEVLIHRYPHELSGGMRQRVLIAMALAGAPQLLVADEPTTALDVTVQGQILRLIADMVESRGLTLILVSHDLGVIGAMCRRIVVMYAGSIVEDAPADALFARPLHPYAQGLIAATPDLDQPSRVIVAMAGMLPDMRDPPVGCRFAARCPVAVDRCRAEKPMLRAVSGTRRVACHLAEVA